MKATESTLQELLGGQKQYQVPLYQRTYSWSTPELTQLWNDLTALSEDYRAGGTGSHFMGSLVLAPSPAISPAGVQEWLIVDGQQRLTTFSVLLCAIRDHRALVDAEQRARIDDLFLINKWNRDAGRYKLLPTQADRDEYLACVDGTPEGVRGEGVAAAYRWFHAALSTMARGDDPLDLALLERVITTGLSFVVITAHADDNVHRIFESLNNTGVRLTQADLLRNYFFMRLPSRGETVYRSVWLPMQTLLSSEELELLLWLDLVLRGDPRAKRNDLYRAEQHRLNKVHNENALEGELAELARRARHLKVILDPGREPDPAVRTRLEHLDAWGSQTAYPLLMHLLDLRDRDQISSAEVAETIGCVESFLVRRMLVGRATNNLNRILSAAASEMPHDRPVPEAVRLYLSGPRKYWTTDAQLRASLATHNFYWTGRATQRAQVLRWLEESYATKEPVRLDGLTIEHVLPQTLNAEWTEVLAQDLVDEATPEDLHAVLVHTIGNLTLTGYNAELSNNAFGTKRHLLAESGVAMNRDIARNDRWGRAQIQHRSAELTERIIALWPGPVDGMPPDELPLWTVMDEILTALPPGVWTTYGDLAEVIGSHPVPVGVRIATTPTPNGHRVLTAQGTISPQFHWYEPGRKDDPVDVLSAEGIKFDEQRHAHPSQRFTAADLADLVGIERDPDTIDATAGHPNAERAAQFQEQLQRQGTPAAAATNHLLAEWRHLGGQVDYGRSAESSAILYYLPYRHRGHILWTAVVYPLIGTLEFSFQHLKSKEPFTDPAVRELLRLKLNTAPGVEIPAAKIGLRPSIRIEQLQDETTRLGIIDAWRWLVATAAADRPHAEASDPMDS